LIFRTSTFLIYNEDILGVVNYVSKWVEALTAPRADAKTVIKFLKKNTFYWFGSPRLLIGGGGSHFCEAQHKKCLEHYVVRHKIASLYRSQTNGQA